MLGTGTEEALTLKGYTETELRGRGAAKRRFFGSETDLDLDALKLKMDERDEEEGEDMEANVELMAMATKEERDKWVYGWSEAFGG